MQEVLISGLLLGMSAGLSPGPLMALVLEQSLRHGAKAGCKTAMAPLVTDLPVILLALWLTVSFMAMKPFLGAISLAGGLYVLHLAWQSFQPPRTITSGADAKPQSWRKGIITNFLSPHPWLFWFTVGAATLLKAKAIGWPAVSLFLMTFYLLLCGIKVVIAVLAGNSRAFLSGRVYHRLLQGLGAALAVFGLLLLRDALKNFGLV